MYRTFLYVEYHFGLPPQPALYIANDVPISRNFLKKPAFFLLFLYAKSHRVAPNHCNHLTLVNIIFLEKSCCGIDPCAISGFAAQFFHRFSFCFAPLTASCIARQRLHPGMWVIYVTCRIPVRPMVHALCPSVCNVFRDPAHEMLPLVPPELHFLCHKSYV